MTHTLARFAQGRPSADSQLMTELEHGLDFSKIPDVTSLNEAGDHTLV